MGNMERLEALVAELPEAERVDVAEWGDHPTFRVRGKNFVFSDQQAEHLSFKLSKEEAEAVVATDPAASPTGYGLGRHGWVSVELPPDVDDEAPREAGARGGRDRGVNTTRHAAAPRRSRRVTDPAVRRRASTGSLPWRLGSPTGRGIRPSTTHLPAAA